MDMKRGLESKMNHDGGKREVSNGFDFASDRAMIPVEEVSLITRRVQTMGTLGPLFYDRPIHVVRGSGAHLFDSNGTDYLDCYNNVACVGHANQHVRDVVADQLGKQDTHSRYLQDEVLDYSDRILAYLPSAIERICFTNSGSESNDLALRMARVSTGHMGVVVTSNAYHGITSLVASVSPSFGNGVPLAPFLAAVEISDVLSGGTPTDQARNIITGRFRDAFAHLHNAGYGVSAVLLDSIFSSDGILPGASGWIADVARDTHAAGGLMIADEVQAGFARTGDSFWGFQRHHADVDIVTMGKPMANGIPTGAVAYKAPIGEAFSACTRYFNTFGGNPVSMRASQAVLDEIESQGLLSHARRIGEYISRELCTILDGTSRFGGIRHAGMFIGVDICDTKHAAPDPMATRTIVNALRDRHVLISSSGPSGSTLKVRPPLVFSTHDVERFLETIRQIKGDGLFD